ncbi:MAG: aspartate aminotransferase family protein [Kiritimatiellia bacterium]
MTKTEQIANLYSQYVVPTYSQSLALVKGKGTRVWDADGQVYLDFISGIATLNIGHCHPAVVAAIREQAGTLMHVSNLFYTENQGRLAEKLVSLAGGGKCFFCNSGAEANEALIKLARLYGQPSGRFEIISMSNSFHGRTLAALAATGQTKHQAGFEPMPEGFIQTPFNDLEALRAKITDQTAGILLEAVQGEGGIITADPAFLQGVQEICREKDILLLCDEVQCGMGRTGEWFAFQGAGIDPDAFSLAKSLGGGLPLGAIVVSPRLADVYQPGKHASTFGGNPVAAAAALATLGVIEKENLLARATEAGQTLKAGLEALVGKYEHVKEVRGVGLMLGLVLDQPAKPLVDALRGMGLIALATAETVVRFLPPLNVKDTEIAEALEIIEDAVAEWHGVERPNADEED